jgi:hypothetical protein
MDKLQVSLNVLEGMKRGTQDFQFADDFAARTGTPLQETIKALQTLNHEGFSVNSKQLEFISALAKGGYGSSSNIISAIAQGARGSFGALDEMFHTNRYRLPRDMFDASGHVKDYNKSFEAILSILQHDHPNAVGANRQSIDAALGRLSGSWDHLLNTLIGSGSVIIFTLNALSVTLQALEIIARGAVAPFMALELAFLYIGKEIANFAKNATIAMPKIHEMAVKMSKQMDADFNTGMSQFKDNLKRILQPVQNGDPTTGNTPDRMGGNMFMARVIREIIGGGQILQLGVKDTELPGIMRLRRQDVVRVRLETNEGSDFRHALEAIIQKTVEGMARHGALNGTV